MCLPLKFDVDFFERVRYTQLVERGIPYPLGPYQTAILIWAFPLRRDEKLTRLVVLAVEPGIIVLRHLNFSRLALAITAANVQDRKSVV